MVTPPGGIVMDPFMGSGSTGRVCPKLGFSFIGIEREEEDSFEISKQRIAVARKELLEMEREIKNVPEREHN